MNRKIKVVANSLLAFIVALILVNCTSHPQSMVLNRTNSQTRTFRSNGDRIYFSSTSDRGTNITYTGMTSSGGMMDGGSSGGMMGNSNLTCASCHGADGSGGVHTMVGMQTMNAPDIRWSALKSEFDTEKFRLAVTKGQIPTAESS